MVIRRRDGSTISSKPRCKPELDSHVTETDNTAIEKPVPSSGIKKAADDDDPQILLESLVCTDV